MVVYATHGESPQDTDEYAWCNTPGWRSEYEAAGKPLHAVDLKTNRSLCGMWRSQWSVDLFNVDTCERCQGIITKRKLKI